MSNRLGSIEGTRRLELVVTPSQPSPTALEPMWASVNGAAQARVILIGPADKTQEEPKPLSEAPRDTAIAA